jgi:hypothetical protein
VVVAVPFTVKPSIPSPIVELADIRIPRVVVGDKYPFTISHDLPNDNPPPPPVASVPQTRFPLASVSIESQEAKLVFESLSPAKVEVEVVAVKFPATTEPATES